MKKLIIILLLFAATASASIFINSFNSGQLGPDMKYRQDLEKTAMGSEELENVLVRPQGMAYKRPGTEFIDTRIREVNIPTTTIVGEYPTLQELTNEEIPDAPAEPADTPLVGETNVNNYAGLQAMAGAGHYNITASIDLTGETWTPIANFSGVIEGNGYTISNLSINQAASDYQAFFANLLTGAEVRNLDFNDCNVIGDDYIAIFAGRIDNAAAVTLKNITISNSSINADYAVGTFIGASDRAYGSNYYDCNAVSCSVTVTDNSPSFVAGWIGFLGTNSGAGTTNFVRCSVQGGTMTVTSTGSNIFYCGGFAGYSGQYLSGSDSGGQHYDCYSTMTMNIIGDSTYSEYIGGFVGKSVFSDYTTCYATGNLSFTETFVDLAGGFAGELRDFNDVINCYATGNLTFNYTGSSIGQAGCVGGFIGLLENQISTWIPGGGHILRCYATGDIIYETGIYTFAEGTAGTGIGGFIGTKSQQDFNSTGNLIERCWAEGDITISAFGTVKTTYYVGVGGFIGSLKTTSQRNNYDLTFQDCYAWGSIEFGDDNTEVAVGGFMGSYVTTNAIYAMDLVIDNVYDAQTDTAAGSGYSNQIPPGNRSNGLIGYVNIAAGSTIAVTNSYWDTDTSDILTDSYATGHITSWMQTKANYEAAGWDFDTIWILTETPTTTYQIIIFDNRSEDPVRLIPFEYSVSDAYVLEFGHEYLGFLRTTP